MVLRGENTSLFFSKSGSKNIVPTSPQKLEAAPAPPLFSRRRGASSTSSSSSPSSSSSVAEDLVTELPDPKTVLGWTVVHAKTGKTIGVVRGVTAGSSSDDDDDDDEGDDESESEGHRRRISSTSSSSASSASFSTAKKSSPPLILRVVNSDVPARFGPGAAELHLLPYVGDVVPAARPARRELVASPPRGLLQLGRQRLLVEYLKPRLHAIARELAGGAKEEEQEAPKKKEDEEEPSSDFDDFDPERDFDGDGDSDDDDFAADLDAPRASSYRTAVMMPTLAQLAAWRGGSGSGSGAASDEEEEGQISLGQQLVRDVRDAGGAAAVAAAVGLRAKRRPVGYWDNLDTLDEELALFVAAHWVELSTSDYGAGPTAAAAGKGKGKGKGEEGGGRYYFNVATRRVRWDAPIEPTTLEIDDCGTRIRIEGGGEGRRKGWSSSSSSPSSSSPFPSAERLMPGRAAVLAAGRYDLHHAIVYHGGYRAVQEMLSRSPAWPPSAAHDDPRDLSAELRAFARAARRGRLRPKSASSSSSSPSKPSVLQMPTMDELADAGRSDLVQAVVRAGGLRAAAAVAGLAPRRPRLPGDASAPAASLEAAAEEIRKVVSSYGGDSSSSSSTSSSASRNCLPTHAALLKAGRGDLRYALQAHGSAAVAAATGLDVPRRGRRKKSELK